MRTSVRWLAAGLALLVGVACSCGGPGPLPGAELRRKLLGYQADRFPQRQFVVGLGAGPTLEAATEAAFGEITHQLTWLPPGSQNLLRGMYRVERSATGAGGQVQLLASLEREEAASHLRRQARDAERSAMDRLPGCRKLLQAGEIEQTEACVARGSAELARAADLIAAARAALGDPASRGRLAGQGDYVTGQQASAGRTSRLSLLLHVLKEVEGQSPGDLDETFASAATESGLKRLDAELGPETAGKALGGSPAGLLALARRAGAGYALVGRVRARFSSEVSGQYFAMADGALKLLETAGGRTVVELACHDVKGGHITRARALEKAVENAVRELLPRLRPKLREPADPAETDRRQPTAKGEPVEKAETQAAFKAIIIGDGRMVAAIAAIPSGPARFFVVQKRETPDAFVGRVSQWIRDAGATGLAMLEPDLLPDGIETGEVLMRVKASLGIPSDAPEAPDYEVQSAELVLGEGKPLS